MAKKYYRQYKVSGVVKFSFDRELGENPEEAESNARYDLASTLECAANHGSLELVEISKVEDLGLSDSEIED